MRFLLLLLAAIVIPLGGCDREGPGPVMEDEESGTFEAFVQPTDGSGFERLEGTATVTASAEDVTVRLLSPLPGQNATTLDLAFMMSAFPAPGTYTLGKEMESDTFLCYQSEIFPSEPYRAESGTVTVTESEPGTLHGEIRATGAFDLQTGPGTTFRRRVTIEGTFRAAPGETGTRLADVRRCLSRG